jgi:aminodeoxyfutalosine deaminase
MTLADYVRAMPKIELHVHLEGTVRPETLLDLARAHRVPLPAADISELQAWYTFRDFDHFVEIFVTICHCLRTADDFARVTYEYGQSMARQNIQYAEVTWTPYAHSGSTVSWPALSWDELLAAINAGREEARRQWGVEMRWIPDIVRSDLGSADTVVRWLTSPSALSGGVIGIGLGGPEKGFPPEPFEIAFREATAKGLHSDPHAGETVGPESVWGAIRALKAERLGHGVRAIEDPALVAYLVKHQIPLEVCPTSNLRLGVYPSYTAHPLRRWVEAGARVTLNSDDPALFNTTLNDEYLHAVQDCGLSVGQLEEVALNAVRASYLPEKRKSQMLATFRAEYERLRRRYDMRQTREHVANDPDTFWANMLSGESGQILSVWNELDPSERTVVHAHLTRMATEAGWSEPQRKSAQAALDVLADRIDAGSHSEDH